MMGELNEVNQPKYLTRTPLASVDWDTFFDAVQDAFKLHTTSYGPPGQLTPVLVRTFPKDNNGNSNTKFDVITSKVIGAVRAGTDPSGKGRIPKGPTLREVKPHPAKARYSIVTIGWWELMRVRFTIYGLSNDRADEITAWFHRMMMRYIFDLSFFRARGVQYMTFQGRGEDGFDKTYGQELYTRILEYDVRLDLLTSFEAKDFESVAVKLGQSPQTEFELNEQYPILKP